MIGKNRKALCFGRAFSVFPTPHILRDKVKEAMKAGYPTIDIKFTDRIAYYNAFDEYYVKYNLEAMEKLFAGSMNERLDSYFAPFCSLCEAFDDSRVIRIVSKTCQNTVNQCISGGLLIMIKILFVCHGNILA